MCFIACTALSRLQLEYCSGHISPVLLISELHQAKALPVIIDESNKYSIVVCAAGFCCKLPATLSLDDRSITCCVS
jgi:hypothetical protein